ncbi:BgtE-20105 [Blumeria graminis f. sp. tritici]|uniref:BgtE-20105 n=2 Tax=Blumeria graminis f. sp. tritici TaxID=62690 RepID=A0A9X9MJG2_BLUGR|nr:BgtE-20105 [Blumeria graminis f. sp. tritici]
MKLIQIVSSVVLFAIPALAVNDWKCGTDTVYAYVIDREMHGAYDAFLALYSLTPSDIQAYMSFKTNFNVPEFNLAGTKFELSFNKEFKVKSFVYIHNNKSRCGTELQTSTF